MMLGVLTADLICRVCTNGDMRFMVRTQDDRCFVECLECMTGYWDARDLATSPVFRTEEATWTAAAATRADVVAAGWQSLIMDAPA